VKEKMNEQEKPTCTRFEEIQKILKNLKTKMDAEPCILKAFVYGSLAKSLTGEGEFKPSSDIDITVVENPQCPLRTRLWYNERIGEVLGHKPDVGVLHLAKDSKQAVNELAKLIQERKPAIVLK
jgi:predicted nucleotidyltransferase